MQYWLMKTEPETYSWDDLVRDTKEKGGEEWNGVRNYEARNNMRKMKQGDKVFIYHSVGDREIVGIAKVVAEAHPDSTDDTGTWDCVDVAAVKPVKRCVNLDEVKTNSKLAEMVLVKRGRLSVQPVTVKEWNIVIDMTRKA
jgi:predicted RNA-binding protein with PUA-like domain